MYIPSKPDRYGLKVIAMCDFKTFYTCNTIPYLGKELRNSNVSIQTQYVLKLPEPIYNTNRNIMAGNWFTSYGFDNKLSENNLILVGTLRKSKANILSELLETKRKPTLSSQFVFDELSTLVSFVPKKKKKNFYNENKGGVDTLDQHCHSKTVSRKTKRWPLKVFYGMLEHCRRKFIYNL
ncbi:hypothetical protein WH47_08389 [Habropoda laboriosa]|uniref:PiggyBac transposable element-derived protein domain-containing protein n=1 Tax=Habropoda laboriosa TaxID=597456 RepID=A0A0L7RH12_9HYME|nr:hypothetical protein WH47_08389 [Habropoda laboriosa]